jgi:drug/metabolite transporter (DMT)-like permease
MHPPHSPRSFLTRAYLLLALGIFFISFSAIFTKWANLPGVTSGFYRLAIAAAVLVVPFYRRRTQHPPLDRRVLALAALGGLWFALDTALWNTSLTLTSAASATLLGNTSSILVALGAWLIFREKLRGRFWIGLFVALIGVLLVLSADWLTPQDTAVLADTKTLGNLVALAAAFFYAAYLLTTQHTRASLDTVSYLFIMSAFGAIVLLPFNVFGGFPLTGFPLQTWAALLALSLITHVGGWLAINDSLGHIPASIVSVTLLAQPVLTAILAIPLLGEALFPLQIIGGMLALIGIYTVNRFGR